MQSKGNEFSRKDALLFGYFCKYLQTRFFGGEVESCVQVGNSQQVDRYEKRRATIHFTCHLLRLSPSYLTHNKQRIIHAHEREPSVSLFSCVEYWRYSRRLEQELKAQYVKYVLNGCAPPPSDCQACLSATACARA